MDIPAFFITYFLLNFFIAIFCLYLLKEKGKRDNKAPELKYYISTFILCLFFASITAFILVVFKEPTVKIMSILEKKVKENENKRA
jgi:uncharacterized membrane protein